MGESDRKEKGERRKWSQSGLNYDATADPYTCVWKTDKAWAGTYRQLTVKLNDDSLHAALFNFTK